MEVAWSHRICAPTFFNKKLMDLIGLKWANPLTKKKRLNQQGHDNNLKLRSKGFDSPAYLVKEFSDKIKNTEHFYQKK
ncbi:hypothetical protein [Fluviicola chungangensis]|uniref:Uncharacterized protein n=1 Tax=Fluviicola chungangensis TaxID=2597671 RepID=A0A556MPM0_9FLAO|nr:hypothetical protein [Fluviicola chungangensis]TSJ41901.1 hypothetical protein FO442_12475 [Fluviicola chungangensis]